MRFHSEAEKVTAMRFRSEAEKESLFFLDTLLIIRTFARLACTTEYIDFICEILAPLGEVRFRKMMSDYVIYVNDKCVITACDNNAFIKKIDCIAPLMADAETGCPYEGAKESYILDFSDQHKARKIISILWEALPLPKKRRANVF